MFSHNIHQKYTEAGDVSYHPALLSMEKRKWTIRRKIIIVIIGMEWMVNASWMDYHQKMERVVLLHHVSPLLSVAPSYMDVECSKIVAYSSVRIDCNFLTTFSSTEDTCIKERSGWCFSIVRIARDYSKRSRVIADPYYRVTSLDRSRWRVVKHTAIWICRPFAYWHFNIVLV